MRPMCLITQDICSSILYFHTSARTHCRRARLAFCRALSLARLAATSDPHLCSSHAQLPGVKPARFLFWQPEGPLRRWGQHDFRAGPNGAVSRPNRKFSQCFRMLEVSGRRAACANTPARASAASTAFSARRRTAAISDRPTLPTCGPHQGPPRTASPPSTKAHAV